MSRRQAVVAVLVVLLTTYALMIGGTTAGTTVPLLRLVTVGICAAAIGLWALVGFRDPRWRPRSVLFPVLVLGLGSLGISSLLSASPRISAEYLAWAIVLASLYLLLVQVLARPYLRDRLIAVAALVGLFLSPFYIVTVLARWSEFWMITGRVAAPPLRPGSAEVIYGNPALVLVMCVLLGAVVAGWAGGLPRGGRLLGGFGVLAAALAAFLTGTRAGWLAVAIGIAAITLIAAAGSERRQGARRALSRWIQGRRRVVTIAALIVLVGGMLVLGPAVLRRVSAGGEEVRSGFYVVAWRIFLSAPIVGVGPGMWAVDRIAFTQPGETDRYVPHAHDIYLQGLAEMGMLGALVGIVGLVFVLWLLRDGLRSTSDLRRRWAWVACFSVAYLAAHEVLDFHLNIPAVLIAAALPIAVLDASAVEHPRMPHLPVSVGRIGMATAPVAVGLALGFLGWQELIAGDASRAVVLANAGDWEAALPIAASVERRDPSMPPYALVTGLAAAHTGDTATARQSITSFAEVTGLPEAWLDVAALRSQIGDGPGAMNALEAAARLGIQRPAVAVAISDLASRLGDAPLAIDAAAAAIDGAPSLAADPWWSDPGRAVLWPAILDRALQGADPEAAWEIRLMASDIPGAIAASGAAADPSLALDVVEAWAGDSSARARIYARCDLEPLSGPVAWCARLASSVGDVALVSKYRDLASLLALDPDSLGEMRATPSPTEPTIAGVTAYPYSFQVYRRLGLWDLLLPGLPHLVVK